MGLIYFLLAMSVFGQNPAKDYQFRELSTEEIKAGDVPVYGAYLFRRKTVVMIPPHLIQLKETTLYELQMYEGQNPEKFIQVTGH